MIFTGTSRFVFGAIFCTLTSFAVSQVFLKYDQEISYANFLELTSIFLNTSTMTPASNAFNSIECGAKCLLTKGCVSYNYKHGGNGGTNCELLAVDRFFNSSLLQSSSNYNYYYVKRMCDDNPCKNHGTCRSYSRTDNYTCECTAQFKGQTCSEPVSCSTEVALGMEHGAIKDNQLSMSSYYDNDPTYGPSNGRLNKNTSPFGAQTGASDPAPWFQIDLLTIKVITAVGIQGYGYVSGNAKTTSFQVSASMDGTTWQWYPGVNQTFPGNTDQVTEVRGQIIHPIKAHMVKIWAKTCTVYCSYRLEVYGCNL